MKARSRTKNRPVKKFKKSFFEFTLFKNNKNYDSILIYFSALCLGEEEGEKFKRQEQMYHQIWSKCKTNTKKAPKINLNLELKKAVADFNDAEKAAYVDRLINWEVMVYKDTDYQLSPACIENKTNWHMARSISSEFTREHDVKWRHPVHRWAHFLRHKPTIMQIFDKYPHLKEHVLGEDNLDFEFCDLWIESKSEFMVICLHSITRCEKTENIDYNSLWDLTEHISKYTLTDNRVPLRDAFRW